jgi:hypothetical protein
VDQTYGLHFQRVEEGIDCLWSTWTLPQQKKYKMALSPWARRFCRVVCTVKLWRDNTGRRSWWCHVLALQTATSGFPKLKPVYYTLL